MKKLTIKEVKTVVTGIEAIDGGLQPFTIEINGKVNAKEAMSMIQEKDYMNKSVKIELVKKTLRVPYPIIETMLNATLSGEYDHPFADYDSSIEEDDDIIEDDCNPVEKEVWVSLNFNSPVYYENFYTPLGLSAVKLIEEDVATYVDDNGNRILYALYYTSFGISIPKKAMEYLESEYSA